MALSIVSCSSDEMTIDTPEITETDDIENYPLLTEDTRNYGKYNSLGYGYNATGEYAHPNAIGEQVIDIDHFEQDHGSRLSSSNILQQSLYDFSASDAAEYTKKLSKQKFSNEFKSYNRNSITHFYNTATTNDGLFDSKYIYANKNLTVTYKRNRINSSNSMLSDYLTAAFSLDIQSKTPMQIIEKYGTHITTDIFVGGKLEMVYQARTKNSNRAEAADALVSYTPNNQNGIGSLNYFKKVSYKSRGGDPALRISGFYNLDKNPLATIVTDKWQNSCTLENSVLVDFGQNGLIPIYDMVQDSTKKAQLKQAVEQYLAANEVKLSK